MKKITFLTSLLVLMTGCERSILPDPQIEKIEYTVKVVDYDLNCNTCIVEFPYYLNIIREVFGQSPNNHYNTINLNQESYKIGEQFSIRVRKPLPNEMMACKALFAADNHLGIYVTESEKFNDIAINDTIVVEYRKCVYNPENQSYLCLDSIIRDSRCPHGMECFIAGNAEVRLKYEKNNEDPVFFNLRTPAYNPLSAIIDGYQIALLELNPYPSIITRMDSNPYSAVLIVKKITPEAY